MPLMRVRDEVEAILRAWDAYERERGAPAIVDFDCHPVDVPTPPASGRLFVLRRLVELRGHADSDLQDRIDSHIAYLRALMGERLPLERYMWATQGCLVAGWPAEYVTRIGQT